MPQSFTLADVLKAAGNALQAGLHTCCPGRIESYDPKTQTASVKPTVRNPIFDPDTGDPDSEEPVVIPNVQVCTPRGGGYHCSFPIEKGDHVVLVFSELATGQWRTTGDISEAVDVRRHGLGSPFALLGAFPDLLALTDPINPLFSGKMIIGKDGDPTASIRLSPGSVECGGLLPVPVAMAAPAIGGLNALAGAMNALQAMLAALAAAATAASLAAVPTDGGKVAFATFATQLGVLSGTLGTAITTATAALTAATSTLPATITKGQ